MTDLHTDPPGTPWQQRRTPVNAIRTALDATFRPAASLGAMNGTRRAPMVSAMVIAWGLAAAILLMTRRHTPTMALVDAILPAAIFAAITILAQLAPFTLLRPGAHNAHRNRLVHAAASHAALIWPVVAFIAATYVFVVFMRLEFSPFNAVRLKAEIMRNAHHVAFVNAALGGILLNAIHFCFTTRELRRRGLSGGAVGSTPGVLRCARCDYDIAGLDDDGRCPECGSAIRLTTMLDRDGTMWQRNPSPATCVRTAFSLITSLKEATDQVRLESNSLVALPLIATIFLQWMIMAAFGIPFDSDWINSAVSVSNFCTGVMIVSTAATVAYGLFTTRIPARRRYILPAVSHGALIWPTFAAASTIFPFGVALFDPRNQESIYETSLTALVLAAVFSALLQLRACAGALKSLRERLTIAHSSPTAS